MKLNLRSIAVATVAATLVAIASLSSTLHAQTNLINLRVNVPFSFNYGETHFASGTYALKMDDRGRLTIHNDKQLATELVQPAYDPALANSSVVIFRKYRNEYFLDQVSMAGSHDRAAVSESKEEKRAAQELAAEGAAATEVTLALR